MSLPPESGPQSEAPLQSTVISPPTLTPERNSWRVALAVEFEPEIDLGVVHCPPVECTGQAQCQGLTQIFVDPSAGLSAPLTVLTDTYSMILQTGERVLVGLRC